MTTFAKDCLAGKMFLITGGLGAIGQVVVGRLLEHSACVTVNDIVEEGRAQQIIREKAWSSDHLAYARADVTRPEEVERLVSRALGAFGLDPVRSIGSNASGPSACCVPALAMLSRLSSCLWSTLPPLARMP